jgi:hypothetical protein
MNDSCIVCTTVCGIGSGHTWRVTVAGQQSSFSTVESSYASPTILYATPLEGLTSGGTLVTLTGSNYAIFASPTVNLDGTALEVWYGSNNDEIKAVIPEGVGQNLSLQIHVGSVSSNKVYYSYSAPHITSANYKTANGEYSHS